MHSFLTGSGALHSIYNSILSQHLVQGGFAGSVNKLCGGLIHAAIVLHTRITQNFLPTAIKFHYVFNLRDLSNIFQVGMSPSKSNMSSYSQSCSFGTAV